MRVAVIGAGVAGLAAAAEAHRLRPDAEVVVFEQSPAVGGKLRTATLAGYPVDVGAEAMLARRAEGLELIDAAGLTGERISPLTTSARVWSPAGLRAIPGGTVMGVPGDLDAARTSGVFSAATLARIAAEATDVHAPIIQDVAVGRLVAERFGAEVVDRLVDPLLGGVYAGRARELSLRATVPALAHALTEHGSLLTAARSAMSPRPAATAQPLFTSVRGGLGRIPAALVAGATFTVRTSTAVRAIRRGATGFVLSIGARPEGVELAVDAVVVATPATKAGGLLRGVAPSAATELHAIETASMAIVSLAVRIGDGRPPLPAGSGLLVPADAPGVVKAVTVSSQKWPGAPDGLGLLRASIGRFGDEAVLQRDDADLIARAVSDTSVLLRVPLVPVDAIVTRWGGALPQYAVGHVERVQRIRAAVAAVPGLAVAGASYDGVGIPATVQTGRLGAKQAITSARPVPPVGGSGQ